MKVFLSVGSLFPFDRLVRAVDEWCRDRPDLDVVAQIGQATYVPGHMRHHAELDAPTFDRLLEEADLVISHAGMGIILKALTSRKPLVVVPRRMAYGEVNTDHQLATARMLEEALGLNVAWHVTDLGRMLQDLSQLQPGRPIGDHASEELLEEIRSFIEGG